MNNKVEEKEKISVSLKLTYVFVMNHIILHKESIQKRKICKQMVFLILKLCKMVIIQKLILNLNHQINLKASTPNKEFLRLPRKNYMSKISKIKNKYI